jgi:O-antigen ligase
MLNSKMMLFVLVLGLAARFMLAGNRVPARTKIIGTALVIALPVLAVFTLPALRERVTKEIGTNMHVVTQDKYRYDTPFTGTSLRLVIWRYCREIVSERSSWLTGVGTGDFQDLLNERYRSTGIYAGGSKPGDTGYIGYGPHNQYIETVFSLGITGLIVFVTFLWLLWKSALRDKHNLFFQLMLLLTLFCFSESVLSTNKGIIFFLFFIFLLYSPVKAQREAGQNEPAAHK